MDQEGLNSLRSGPCSATRTIFSNLSPIFSNTAMEPTFSGEVIATTRCSPSTRFAYSRMAAADSTAYPFERYLDRNANPTSASARPSRLTNPHVHGPLAQVATGVFQRANSLVADKLQKGRLIQQFENEIGIVQFQLAQR
jgi:hypothetical protein